MFRSLWIVAATCAPVAAADGVEVRLTADTPPAVEVTGLTAAQTNWLKTLKPDDAAWAEVLRLNLADARRKAGVPAVLGRYRVVDNRLRFEPRFPLVPGVHYEAHFNFGPFPDTPPLPKAPPGGVILRAGITADLQIPKPAAVPTAVVSQISPTADTLPENALRLYVQFSAPMSRGVADRHLSLLDAAGKPVPFPFLDLGEELWTADATRYTLYFHPGRVKRGLASREEEGPVLEAGKRYTLVVSAAWPDAEGRPLKAEYRKAFTAGPLDAEPVDPQRWAITEPAGRGDPLVVRLPKPLDRGLLQRLVWVTDDAGKRIDGVATVGDGERSLSFAPTKPWAAGRYRLVVDSRLEDPCGNRVGEAFEVDETATAKPREVTVTRAFAVR